MDIIIFIKVGNDEKLSIIGHLGDLELVVQPTNN
jgi:hypothetical protein